MNQKKIKKENFFQKVKNKFQFGTRNYFAVVDRKNPSVYLTIVKNKKDAKEYATSYIKAKHGPHYLAWCKIQKLKSTSNSTWIQYCQNCISPDELMQYAVIKLPFTPDSISSIIRMFYGTTPLNCSFETAGELFYFQKRLYDNQVSEEQLEIIESNKSLTKDNQKINQMYEQALQMWQELSKSDADFETTNIENPPESLENKDNGTK